MKNEFSRPVVLANIPRSGQRESLSATPEEREAVARRLGLLSLEKLEAKVALTPQAGGSIAVRGQMRASVTQACVAPAPASPRRPGSRLYAPRP